MLSNEDKIKLIYERLNNIQGNIKSYINHAEQFKDKYSLEHELLICNSQKNALINELKILGGSWTDSLD